VQTLLIMPEMSQLDTIQYSLAMILMMTIMMKIKKMILITTMTSMMMMCDLNDDV